MFPEGCTLTYGGSRLTVGDRIAGGGEGAVHRVHDSDGTAILALKTYDRVDPQRWDQLVELVDRGNPLEGRFVWPLQIVRSGDGRTFGHLMALAPPSYVPASELLRGGTRDMRVLMRTCFELAHSMLALNTRGLCYRDISWSNVLVDPTTGAVLLIDTDNVGVDNTHHTALVRGTDKFMAPELVRGDDVPSRRTDQHALAVLLFLLLVVAHPLEGRRAAGLLDRGACLRLFGHDPLFIFDPDDDSNRLDPVSAARHEQEWRRYPGFVRALFTRAFTAGLHDPRSRVHAGTWCRAVIRLRDGLVSCGTCSWDLFLDPDRPDVTCRCGTRIPWGRRIDIRGHHLAVGSDTLVTRHHVRNDLAVADVLGRGELHPTDATRVGLRNDGEEDWTYRAPDGRTGVVRPGQRVDLRTGMAFQIVAASLMSRATVADGPPSDRAIDALARESLPPDGGPTAE